jgi:hypothetical protein
MSKKKKTSEERVRLSEEGEQKEEKEIKTRSQILRISKKDLGLKK